MLYSILIYGSEAEVDTRTREQAAAHAAEHAAAQRALATAGQLGPAAHLMGTTVATTLRSRGEPVVLDGPCAEAPEALLGFYVVDCASLEDALAAARRLPRGTFEIRPISGFHPGTLRRSGEPQEGT
jgi:hypothetical protein